MVIGGSGYSLVPKELLQHLDVDFGIVGEGEEVFLQLVRSLERGDPISPSPHLLIKGTPFPHSIEGARVFPIKLLIEPFLRRSVIWKKEEWEISRQSEAALSPVFTAPTLYWKGKIRLRKTEEVVEEIRTHPGGGVGLHLLC